MVDSQFLESREARLAKAWKELCQKELEKKDKKEKK